MCTTRQNSQHKEWFSTEWGKPKTKIISLASHKGHRIQWTNQNSKQIPVHVANMMQGKSYRNYRLSQSVWTMHCSQSAKKEKWLAYVRIVDNSLATFEIHVHVISQRNVYPTSWKYKALEQKKIKALELRLTGLDVLVILHCTKRLWKELNLSSVLLGVAFASNPNTIIVLVISLLNTRSTALSKNNSVNTNWLSMTFLFLFERLICTFTWNKTFSWNFQLLSANMSLLQLNDLQCQIHCTYCKFLVWTLHLKFLQ